MKWIMLTTVLLPFLVFADTPETLCERSRFGDTEAMYRLGLLYVYGQTVEQNVPYGKNLLATASRQGHQRAFNTLEPFADVVEQVPDCLYGSAPPKLKLPEHEEVVAVAAPKEIRSLTKTIGSIYKVDYNLILAVMHTESNFNPRARSNKDAHGLMQLIPATASRFNVSNIYDVAENIRGGVRYLRWLLAYYRGDVELVLAAYNAGEGAVDRFQGIPPYRETREYVKRIRNMYSATTHPFDPTNHPGTKWIK